MTTELVKRVQDWIADDPDETTAQQAQAVLDLADNGDEQALTQLSEWFGPFLQFGTAGLRGPLGPGPSCMNRAVVSRAAAGLCSYLLKRNAKKIVVGYDARHRSIDFALDTVAIASGAGLEAILLPSALPTPVLAYATRAFGADAGVMVTASHNPAQDNGYKVYLADGSQIVPPADTDIAHEISLITSVRNIPTADNWYTSDNAIIDEYIAKAAAVVHPESPKNLIVATTPMHGVGHETWNAVFDRVGFGTLHVVKEQELPDPDFPTVVFPNPEEPGATDLLLALAGKIDADVAIAHDPDADRCAVGSKNHSGQWRLLRGDEVGALLGWWTIERARIFDIPLAEGTFAASIVSSSLLGHIAKKHNRGFQQTLTGFKWIGKIPDLIFGFEEALGYCVDPANVRDKDGISASARVCELVAYLKTQGKLLEDVLDAIAMEYGLFATDQLSVRMKDLAAIPAAVARLRNQPPTSVGGLAVTDVVDMKNGYKGLPPTDGILLQLDGGRVIARPSGTEPKLKCYLEVIIHGNDVAASRASATQTIAKMKTDMAEALGI